VAVERGAAALASLIADEDDVSMAAVTVAELLVGAELAAARYQQRRRAFVEDLIAAIPIDDYDLGVARTHAALLAHTRSTGLNRGAHDLIIAATALARARIVVTADRRGFEGLPAVAVRAAAE
jgi:tRNA(fMet)-specific endonuclease VapC